MLLTLEPHQLTDEAKKRGIPPDQAETLASRLAKKLLPHVQNGLPQATVVRQWLRELPGEWRAKMHAKLGEADKLPGHSPDFYNTALMQHVKEVS